MAEKISKLYGYVYLWLKLLFGWLTTCSRRHHAVPLSVADLAWGDRGVATHPLESNFFFSFLFNFNSTIHPTPFTTPSLSVNPPPPRRRARSARAGDFTGNSFILYPLPPSPSLGFLYPSLP